MLAVRVPLLSSNRGDFRGDIDGSTQFNSVHPHYTRNGDGDMRLHAVTSTFILCKPEVVGSIPIVSTIGHYKHGGRISGLFFFVRFTCVIFIAIHFRSETICVCFVGRTVGGRTTALRPAW